jgi:alcohol dehydrogenase
MAANGGRGADVIFDATGHPGSMSRCFEYAAFGARIVYVGITSDPVNLPDPLFHRRELTLLATRNAVPTDFTRILGLIRDGRIKTSPWITHRAAFATVPDQFETWLRPESGMVKAVIDLA